MTMKQRIVEAYDQHILRRSVLSIREAGEDVFAEAMRPRPKHALEIGTYRGVGAAVMSQFADKVTTLDLKHGRMEQLGETWDRHAFWERLGITNVELRLLNSADEIGAVVGALDFDFAFIDGAHDAASVARDFGLVKRCGRVLFHDYDHRGIPDKDCTSAFVDKLPGVVKTFDLFALWTPAHG